MVVGGVGGIVGEWILGMDGDCWVVLGYAGESNVRKLEIILSGVWGSKGERGVAGRWSWVCGGVRGGLLVAVALWNGGKS